MKLNNPPSAASNEGKGGIYYDLARVGMWARKKKPISARKKARKKTQNFFFLFFSFSFSLSLSLSLSLFLFLFFSFSFSLSLSLRVFCIHFSQWILVFFLRWEWGGGRVGASTKKRMRVGDRCVQWDNNKQTNKKKAATLIFTKQGTSPSPWSGVPLPWHTLWPPNRSPFDYCALSGVQRTLPLWLPRESSDLDPHSNDDCDKR